MSRRTIKRNRLHRSLERLTAHRTDTQAKKRILCNNPEVIPGLRN